MRVGLLPAFRATAVPPKYAYMAAIFLILIWVNFPGHMNYDSLLQLLEGRTRTYNSIHPPIMSALMGICDFLLAGPGLFCLIDMLLLVASFVMISRHRRFGMITWIVLPIVLLNPVLLLYAGAITKDVLFAHALLLGLVLLFGATSAATFGAGQFAASLLLLAVASMARQQGYLIAGFGGVVLLALHKYSGDGKRKPWFAGGRIRLVVAYIAGLSATVVALSVLIPLTARSGPADVLRAGAQILEYYDLAGIHDRQRSARLDVLRDHGIDTDLMAEIMRSAYGPDRWDHLFWANQPLWVSVSSTDGALTQQWLESVRTYPGAYLSHRLQVFRYLLGLGDRNKCSYVPASGVPDDVTAAPLVRALDLVPGPSARAAELVRISWQYRNSILYYPVFYLILAVGALGLAFRSELRALIVAINASAIFFTATFFIIGIACDFRYLYILVVASGFSLFALSLKPKGRAQASSLGATPARVPSGRAAP